MIPSKTFSRIWKCGGGFTLINKTNLSLSFCNICLLCGQNRSTRHFSKGLYTWRWGTPGRWGNPPNRGRKIKCVYMQSYNPVVLGWGFLRLLLRSQLRSLSRGVPCPHLEKDERLILEHICIYSWKRHALCYAVFGFARNRWLNTLYGIVWETKYGRFTTLNIPKCEHFTPLVCPLQFLVISAMRRLENMQSFKKLYGQAGYLTYLGSPTSM